MDFPIHIDTVSMKLSILYFKGSSVTIYKMILYLSLDSVFILYDEMAPYAAFHLGLHCLPKYLFSGIQNENGYATNKW